MYSTPKKSPGASRRRRPGCMEKPERFHLQVTGGKRQVIYFSSFPPHCGCGDLKLLVNLVFQQGQKTKRTVRLEISWGPFEPELPRGPVILWSRLFKDKAGQNFTRARGALHLLSLRYFHHRVCEHWRSLDRVLAPPKELFTSRSKVFLWQKSTHQNVCSCFFWWFPKCQQRERLQVRRPKGRSVWHPKLFSSRAFLPVERLGKGSSYQLNKSVGLQVFHFIW